MSTPINRKRTPKRSSSVSHNMSSSSFRYSTTTPISYRSNDIDQKYQKLKTSYQNNLKELAEYQSINAKLRSENQKLSKLVIEHKKKIIFLNTNNTKLKDELQAVNAYKMQEVENYKKEKETVQILEEQNQSLQDDLNKSIQILSKVQVAMEQLKTKYLSKKQKLDEFDSSIQTHQSIIQQVSNALQVMRNDNENFRKSIKKNQIGQSETLQNLNKFTKQIDQIDEILHNTKVHNVPTRQRKQRTKERITWQIQSPNQRSKEQNNENDILKEILKTIKNENDRNNINIKDIPKVISEMKKNGTIEAQKYKAKNKALKMRIDELERMSSNNLSELAFQYDAYELLNDEYKKSLELINELKNEA